MTSVKPVLALAKILTCCSLLLGITQSVRAAIPSFTEHLMGNTGETNQGQTTLVDVDLDGDLDWLMGTQNAGTYFWEFKGYTAGKANWVMHKIGDGGGCETSGVAMDITGDGYPDMIVGSKWWKNPGKSGNITGPWQVFTNNGVKVNCADAIIGDWNNDKKLDVAFVQRGQIAAWYETNPQGPWIEHIWPGIQIHSGLAAGDFNNDGFLDAVVDNILFLSKNKAGSAWDQVTLPYSARPTDGVIVEAGDVDGDGDMDLVQMGHWTTGPVSWVENVDGTGKVWANHVLPGNVGDLSHSVNIADIDNDGDMDLELGADGGASFWYEQTSPKVFKATSFTSRPTHDMRVGDVDRDGDLDMIGKPWGVGPHYFFQNMLVDNGGVKKDWSRGPIGSHNPTNWNRIQLNGCMDPKSSNYDPWALHSGPITQFCGTTTLIQPKTESTSGAFAGRFFSFPEQGPYSLTLRTLDGSLISSLNGQATDPIDLLPMYQKARPGIYFLAGQVNDRKTETRIIVK